MESLVDMAEAGGTRQIKGLGIGRVMTNDTGLVPLIGRQILIKG